MSAIERLEEQVNNLKVRASSARRAAEEQITHAIHTGESLGAAALVGYLEGSGRTVNVMGLDTSQVLGGGALVGSLLVDDKDLAGHLRAMGVGGLAAFAYRKGKEVGEQNPSSP